MNRIALTMRGFGSVGIELGEVLRVGRCDSDGEFDGVAVGEMDGTSDGIELG